LAEPGVDSFCVPSLFAHADIVRHRSGDENDVTMTGIPVRAAFERIEPVSMPRDGEPLRVLVTSGGFGVGPMRRIVRSFAGIRDVALTVVCGASEALVADVERDVREAGVHARVIGFERDMPSRVAEAHVVVGKAGGLTVSETLTAGRPMIVVGAVPGNEKHNEAFVVGGGAGVAAEPEEVGAIASTLRARGLLRSMGERGRLLVVSHAADRVLDVAMAHAPGSAHAA
jgi:UDP-N-acetylglucosamine:LPS N-acetylglucosamine transferase